MKLIFLLFFCASAFASSYDVVARSYKERIVLDLTTKEEKSEACGLVVSSLYLNAPQGAHPGLIAITLKKQGPFCIQVIGHQTAKVVIHKKTGLQEGAYRLDLDGEPAGLLVLDEETVQFKQESEGDISLPAPLPLPVPLPSL